MTLYELTDQLEQLRELAEDPDIDPQTIADTMEGVEGEFEAKAEGYAMVLQDLKAQAAALDAEERRLKAKREAIQKNAARIKERLKVAMEKTGKTKFKTPLFSFSTRATQGNLVIDYPDMVFDEYLIPQAPKVDGKAIKEAIKAGQVFEWCHIEPGTALTIR